MSWYPDLYIGELRPWPDAVYVWRGKTGESKRYLPDDFCALARENNELRELVREMVLNMGGCALHGNPLRLREFGSRAIELGIEVNA